MMDFKKPIYHSWFDQVLGRDNDVSFSVVPLKIIVISQHFINHFAHVGTSDCISSIVQVVGTHAAKDLSQMVVINFTNQSNLDQDVIISCIFTYLDGNVFLPNLYTLDIINYIEANYTVEPMDIKIVDRSVDLNFCIFNYQVYVCTICTDNKTGKVQAKGPHVLCIFFIRNESKALSTQRGF